MVQDPSAGDIGDARTAVAITNFPQHGKESLEESPVAPYSGDRVQILWYRFQRGTISGLVTRKQRREGEKVDSRGQIKMGPWRDGGEGKGRGRGQRRRRARDKTRFTHLALRWG